MFTTMTRRTVMIIVALLVALLAGAAATTLHSSHPAQAPAKVEQPAGGGAGGRVAYE
jgi:flagellar basal body-associated protein FliL